MYKRQAIAIVVTIITYFSLIIGELVPKTIAFNNPEGITITLAPFMKFLSWLTTPIVYFLSISTKVFLKAVSYTHLRAHETVLDIVCRLLLEKKQSEK